MSEELIISIRGEIEHSNLDEFATALKSRIAEINQTLSTDDDFAEADRNAKALKQTEDALKAAKDKALEQAADVQKLFAAIDDISGDAREARLSLERQIKQRKEERKTEIIEEAKRCLRCKAASREIIQRLHDATKRKQSFHAMEISVFEVVDAVNAHVRQTHEILDRFSEEHGADMVPDYKALEHYDIDVLQQTLDNRVAKRKLEQEKRKLEQEKRELEEKRKADEAAARKAAAPAPNPRVQEQNPMVAEYEELAYFYNKTIEALAILKQLRDEIKFPTNAKKVEIFSQNVRNGLACIKPVKPEPQPEELDI